MWEGFQRQRQKDLRIVKVGRGNELKTPSGALIYVPERLVEQQCRQREWVGWSILGFRCEHDRSCGSWMNTPMAISQQKASSDVHSRSTWDRGACHRSMGGRLALPSLGNCFFRMVQDESPVCLPCKQVGKRRGDRSEPCSLRTGPRSCTLLFLSTGQISSLGHI